nr:aminopeptidase N-like [Cherax quadricarinatus]
MLVMKPNTTTTTTTTDAPHLQSPNTTPTTIITISNTLPSQQPNATEATTTSEGVKVVVLSSDPAHQNKQDLFLPKTLKPLHYTIKIQPFINGNQTIHGYMEVEVEVLEPTSNITMHFFNMNIDTNTVKLAAMEDKERKEGGRLKKEHNEGLPTVEYISVDIRRQFFTAHLTGQLQRGSRFLYSMSYVASLNNYRSGFFSAHYSDNDGTQRRLMATLLQPTNARKAFPCFDEPELKATFELYVTREINMTAISNMPLRNTTPMEGQEGWMVDQFVTSPLMSTYHLVLIISQLHYVDATNDGGVPIRIWARPDVLEKTSMIQQVVPKLLSFFEDYLSVPYSLPKLDFVAVPSGFGVAFEGWGIIVGFEERMMLYEPEEDNEDHKERVVSLQAHEIAHQWFGNLVTPRWWNNLWLSEGFATYLHLISVSYVMPSNKTLEHSMLETFQRVLRIDSQPSSHSISLPVFKPDKIEELFDDISYFKGSSIIYMMSHFLSSTTFRKGIMNFLNGCQYSNADQEDLWRYMTEAARQDNTLPGDVTVKMIMDTWTLQAGYPVITVHRSTDGTSATVYQEKISLELENNVKDSDYTKWWVPLTYTWQDELSFNLTQPRVWMRNTESQLSVQALPSKEQWVIFNLQRTGYYRVNYDLHNWDLIIQQLLLDFTVIPVTNRAQLIDDALDLALAGKLSYKTALDVTMYVKNEKEMLPFIALSSNLELMEKIIKETPVYDSFKKYALSLLVPLYITLELDNEESMLKMQKEHAQLTNWICRLGHSDCVHLATSLYRQWMKTPNLIESVTHEVRGIVYCTAIANGGKKEWQFAWQRYFQTKDDKHKDQIILALSCSKDPWVKAGYLYITFSSEVKLRESDAFEVYSSMAASDPGQDAAWSFLLQNWDTVTEVFGKENGEIELLLMTSLNSDNTRHDLMQLEIFRKTYSNDNTYPKAQESATDKTSFKIAWMNRNYKVICEWLDSHGFSTMLEIY